MRHSFTTINAAGNGNESSHRNLPCFSRYLDSTQTICFSTYFRAPFFCLTTVYFPPEIGRLEQLNLAHELKSLISIFSRWVCMSHCLGQVFFVPSAFCHHCHNAVRAGQKGEERCDPIGKCSFPQGRDNK